MSNGKRETKDERSETTNEKSHYEESSTAFPDSIGEVILELK